MQDAADVTLAAYIIALRESGYDHFAALVRAERWSPHLIAFVLRSLSFSKHRAQDAAVTLLAGAVGRYRCTPVGQHHSPQPELDLARDGIALRNQADAKTMLNRCERDAADLVDQRLPDIKRLSVLIATSLPARQQHHVDHEDQPTHFCHEVDQRVGHLTPPAAHAA
jgi:hypothetical protein